MSHDNIMMGNCRRAVDYTSGEIVWEARNSRGKMLLASCTYLGKRGLDFFRAGDCINGTLIPQNILGSKPTNLTTLQEIFAALGKPEVRARCG